MTTHKSDSSELNRIIEDYGLALATDGKQGNGRIGTKRALLAWHTKELEAAVVAARIDEWLRIFPHVLSWEDNRKGAGIRREEIFNRLTDLMKENKVQ